RAIVDPFLERTRDEGGWLEPEEVSGLLEAVGLTVPVTKVATTEDEAVALAGDIGRSVLKVISPSALHKSDVGGVVLDVSGESEVRKAYQQVTTAVPDPEGVVVQSFIPAGHEVLIGSTEDPSFGALIVFGLGGVTVELLGDVAFRIHPLTDVDVGEMVRSIKGFRMLEGYRNMPEGDVEAVEEALLRVSTLISEVPEIVEMDLNPVKV